MSSLSITKSILKLNKLTANVNGAQRAVLTGRDEGHVMTIKLQQQNLFYCSSLKMNKTLQVIVIFTLAVSCYAVRFYSNPIEKSNNPDPGAIYVDDLKTVFVAVTTDNNSDADKFPIRASKITDLTSWPIVSHVFPSGYKHPWAGQDFWAPVSNIKINQDILRQLNEKKCCKLTF